MSSEYSPLPHHEDVFPLSSPQLDIYHDQLMKGRVPTYNIGGYLDFFGEIDVEIFQQALHLVIQMHDSLRIMLVDTQEAVPAQRIVQDAGVSPLFIDFSSRESPEQEARAWMDRHFNLPFDVVGQPLFRCALIKIGPGRFHWFICAHHLITDGWSMDTIFQSLAKAYSALEHGEDVELHAPSYTRFIESDRQYVDSPAFQKDRDYWLGKFADVPDPLLSIRHPAYAGNLTATAESIWPLDRSLSEQIDALASAQQSTRFQVLLGLFYAFFLRLEQRDELTIGLSVLNRKDAEFRKTAGMFTNVAPMRLHVDKQASFVDLLKAIAPAMRQDYRHQRFPVGALNKGLGLFEHHRSQIYDLSMSYENGGTPLHFGDTTAFAVKCTNDHEGTPLRLCVRDDLHRHETAMYFIFGRAYFNEGEIRELQARFTGFMTALLADPSLPLATVPIVTANEEALFAAWNTTDAAFPLDTLHALFQRQAQQRPDATALVHRDVALSYAELDAAANRLAQHLHALGVSADDRIALCVERSPAMIIGLLAILKAGGAYVPIDPAYPSERLGHILSDARPRLLLADSAGRNALASSPALPACVDLDNDAAWAGLPAQAPQSNVAPHHLAYIIYTSGSTGQPKGVMIEHRQVSHQVVALQRAYGLHAGDCLLQFASMAFDMSVEEIFPALLTGATLVLRTDECLGSPASFAAFCHRHQLTSLNLPSSFWAQLALAEPEIELPACLRLVTVGGDAISLSAVAAWLARRGDRPRLFNAYGPTETTVNASMLEIEQAPDVSSIGRPIANTRIYLLDDNRQAVPIGAVGEIHVGGTGVARGYLDRPELTAERFLHDPFAGAPGARMYRTGDLARHLPDGQIEFLGRNDNQVKIRGYRIELGEIESRLSQHPSVREAVVLALGEGADKRLVAYAVAQDATVDDTSLIASWRTHLADELPDYMVPAAFVRLDAFPLTAHGKLDRKALPAPGELAFAHRAYEPPQGDTELALAQLWGELLGVSQIGRHDHFFELGGHSLVAIRLLGKVSQQFDHALPLASLFNHPTLAGLATIIDSHHAHGENRPAIVPVTREATLPLSYAQQRLWFMAQLDNAHATYHVSLVLHLTGELDEQALRNSLDRLLSRHEALRTVFLAVDGDPQAALLPATTPFPWQTMDLRGQADAEARLAEQIDENANAAYDLEQGPLIRARLIHLAERQYTLLIGMHHIIADGWSMNLLAREISALYTAFAAGQADPLPPLPVQYPDYASWQRQVLTAERLQSQAEFWRETLRDAPELLNLPTDRPRPPRQSFAGAMLPIHLDARLTDDLKRLGKEHGVSLFMLISAAWSAVLGRLAGQDDIVIGTLSANRSQREIEQLIGFFVSTLPLRVDLSGTPDTPELLARVRRAALAVQENQDLPFEQVVDIARPSRRLDHSPIFQVLLAWQSNDKSRFELPGLEVQQAQMSLASIRYDLELHLYEQENTVIGGLGYATALFDQASIARHIGYLVTMLEGMASQVQRPVQQIPLVGAQEQALLEHWNDTAASYPDEQGIHRLFERQAARSPHAVALIHGERELSYLALNQRANRLARYLREQGIGADGHADQRIALCAGRDFEMITALLAILKAGASYVPLDPSYPSERLQQILGEAGAEWTLADAEGRAALGDDALAKHRVIALETLPAKCSELSGDDLVDALETSPDRLAYVIYTSGSTGTPKGVAMPHRPLINLIQWQLQTSAQAQLAAPRTLQFAALGFDVAFQEIFSSLCAGASLVLVDAQLRLQFDALIGELRRQQVQRAFLPYIALQALAEAAEDIPDDDAGLLPELREIIVAGEQLRLTPQIQRLFRRLPACSLHNHYGPTETHVVSAEVLPAGAIAEAPSHVPIGRPIAGSRFYLLDGYGQPVPIGVAGELHIGGIGIARGYLDRDDLTAERFLADPFDTRPDTRMYRTGDLARYLPDGRLVFLGRNDHQVKVRGFRIELGEIEARLAEHAAVRECAVIARQDARGDTQLVAYVVPSSDTDGLPATWHAYLGSALPAYMVPSAFVTLPAIPLTAHGKLDRKALPAPDEQAFARSAYEAPAGDIESTLARLWQDLLGVAQVGRHDHFFELGGHSLVAVRLLSRIAQTFGVQLPLANLFANPLLRELANEVAGARAEQEHHPTGIVPVPRAADLPLSHAQRRLWFLAQLDADSATYHIPLAMRLDGALDTAALRTALDRLFARHESLRTIFVARQGQPFAHLLPADAGLALRDIDLTPSVNRERALREVLADERNRPFDLAGGPLIRACLVHQADASYVLQLTLHHIIADGWSLGIVSQELGDYYRAALYGEEAALAPLPIQYADYVAWEHRQQGSERLAQQAAYWRKQLAQAPALLELPTDRPRPPRQSFEGAFLPWSLDNATTQQLKLLAQQHGVTLFMVVLAAWAVVLSRLSGQSDVLIGSPSAGRHQQALESLIGFFVNTLALRIHVDAAADTAALLAQVRQIALEAQANQDLPFEQVVELADVPRRIDQTPLVQVLFAWQSHDEGKLELPGIVAEPLPAFDWVKFDLELILSEQHGRIEGGFNYASALFDQATIERHGGYLHTVLKAMASTARQRASQLPMLSQAERQLLLEDWNRTTEPYPDQMCMHQWAEHWAEQTPDAIVLVSDEFRLSYAQLNAQANQLAHHLIAQGVQPDQRVALCVEKGANMFVGLLGIMKAGGAYVPLDPAYASTRLDHILEDAAPRLLLCDDVGRAALGDTVLATVQTIALGDSPAWSGLSTDNPVVPGLDARRLAYIIYTSGSTGRPKGVMVEHRGVTNLALSLAERLGVTASSRVSQFASLGFDASIFESAMTLAMGGALYLPSVAERQSPSAFMAFIGRHQISHATLPPAFLQGHAHAPRWLHRPTLILAGEASHPGLLKTWARYARLANAYGPTEITVCAAVWVGNEPLGELDTVSIGRPLANTRLYVLDEHGEPMPRGSIGELYIGGVGVARGYLNRPDLTRERFLADPFDSRTGARMYRSGDLVRYLPDGNLVFVGRNDHQVKLRGFRIELGEIEANLSAHPAVQENVVLAREDQPGETRLVAYVVSEGNEADLSAQLRDHLVGRLPDYMIPAAFVVLESLPLTPHGKLDRKALPAPDDQAFARRRYVAPQGDAETTLAALWKDLLGLERIGRHDHFFELGGHSLLVAQLVARMQEAFGRPVAIREVFDHPVLLDMATLVLAEPAKATTTLDLDVECVLDDAIRPTSAASDKRSIEHILLTGASGFLGAFLLDTLLKRTPATMHCLVRSADREEGRAKLDANMRSLGLDDYDRSRVLIVPGDLALPGLGLDRRAFDQLAERIDAIYHNGAWVNSLHSYASMKAANVLGTQEILRLAAQGTPKHIHYVSTLSTIPPQASVPAHITTEAELVDHWPALPSGYAQSKWVAERLLQLGGKRGIPFTIYRPTHIAGESRTGASNASDTWSLFVDACLMLERVPDVDTAINSLPVDYMANGIIELSLRPAMNGQSLNLASPTPFALKELTRQIEAIQELDVKRIDYREWWQLCHEHPATRRLATVMPSELAQDDGVDPTVDRIEVSNAVHTLATQGMPYPPMTPELLRRFVRWRYRQCAQPA